MILLTIAAFGTSACTKENTTCDDSNVTYESHIKNIFASCTAIGCHNSNSINGSLASYEDTKTFPKKARLIGSISWSEGYVQMPQGQSKLSDCDIAKIEKWLAAGQPQ